MVRSRSVVVCTSLCVVLYASSAARGIGHAGQRIAAEVTLASLPEPLASFFEDRGDAVIERTIEPDGAWRRDARYQRRDEWHYLALDAASESDTWEDRLRAARAFPTRRAEARKLFRDRDFKHGGSLPWQLDDLAGELSDAFHRGDETEIVRLTGHVVHFATDAADPFAATRDRRGALLGGPVFATVDMGDPMFAHQDAAQRIGWELIRRNAQRYRGAIDPAALRFELTVDDVPFATIECMVASLERLAEMCTADREILEQMQVTDQEALLARADEYYQLLDARCGETCVDNLRRSARLATTLIVSAWRRAGSPDPIGSPQPVAEALTGSASAQQPATPQSSPPPAAAQPQAAVGFVASRRSQVYHRDDCHHVARISPDNLVAYQSPAEAEADGKRPCRTCHPEQAQAGGAANANDSATE